MLRCGAGVSSQESVRLYREPRPFWRETIPRCDAKACPLYRRPGEEWSMDKPTTRSLDEIRGALEGCYASVETLCADLSDADWQAQSLCPDWTVRGVVDHVTSIEAVMTGWLPDDDRTPPPFERAAEFLSGHRRPALLTSRRCARSTTVGVVIWPRSRTPTCERPSWMPTGPGTYGRFLAIRVFDFWVHERDITTPLGRADRRHRHRGRDRAGGGGELDRLHRRQEGGLARRQEHRLPI